MPGDLISSLPSIHASLCSATCLDRLETTLGEQTEGKTSPPLPPSPTGRGGSVLGNFCDKVETADALHHDSDGLKPIARRI